MGIPFPKKKAIQVTNPNKPSNGTSVDNLPISDLCLDKTELCLLTGVRLIATSYAAPATQGWQQAFDKMQDEFGPEHGPIVAYALVNVIRALRQSRKSTFLFNDPACPCCHKTVTPMERYLVTAVKAKREGKITAAHTNTMILCEGHSTIALNRAIETLIALLPIAGQRQSAKTMRFF